MELKIEHLSKQFKDKTAVNDVNLTLTPGVWGLLGANGAGKTTLMRMIADIMTPTNGAVYYDGKDIRELGEVYRSKFGFLPQDFGYHRDFTVKDYLEYMAALKDIPTRATTQKINHLLDILSLSDVKKKKISNLSGGMKRRVGIAQAMLNDPEILVMDEPTAGLDPQGRDDILDQIVALHKMRGITIILVSHSMEDIAKYVERLIVMNHGEAVFDDEPKKVFSHYKELETMGLAAPQITYIMHALKEKGLPVDPADTTVEEAKQDILHALREMNSSLLKGGVQND